MEKKSYSAPKLTTLGDVEKITKGSEFQSSGDEFLGFIFGPPDDPGTGS